MDWNSGNLVYRVRGLPDHIDKLGAVEVLYQAIGDIQASDIRMFSLATCLSPWERPPTKTATVMFNKVPSILRNEKAQWKLDVKRTGLRRNIIIDTHFLGLTPLNDVASTDHLVDCIAISGLASHPFGSWKQRGDSTFMWIRDAVPRALPGVRCISYGYDTALLESNSFQGIDDLALELIGQLEASGWISESAKPIVFLAHSLGGIVLKRAFVFLADSGERATHLLEIIKGGICFGAPSLGMNISHLMPMIQGQPNENLARDLALESDYLEELEKSFSGIAYLRCMKLFWAYELRKSPTVIRGDDGKFSRSGPDEILVSPLSATRNLINSDPSCTFPINEDHSNMVKFAEDDSNYTVVISKLRMICAERQVFPTASVPDKYSKNPSRPPVRSISAVQSSDLINNFSNYLSKLKLAEMESLEQQLKNLMNSLHAPERDSRLEQIEEKFESTFDWIFQDPSTGFVQWLLSGEGIYWISGKPGSGKSIMMKFIYQHPRTVALLRDWKSNNIHIFVGFFFHYRGSFLQKSFEGLLRSLLSQILDGRHFLQRMILPLYLERGQGGWNLESLERAVLLILQQQDYPLDICCLFDALDEYDGPPEFISNFLASLVETSSSSSTRVKICFSSRPWDVFTDKFGHLPGIKIHERTEDDIRTYAAGRIDPNHDATAQLYRLVPDVVSRAKGVFLWVKLVIHDLLTTATGLQSDQELREHLNSLPYELDAYYGTIVSRIPEGFRWDAYVILEIVSRSTQPPSVWELKECLECAASSSFEDGFRKVSDMRSRFSADSLALFGRQLKHRCGGLVETYQVGGPTKVQLMHQTVQEFVTRPNFRSLVLGVRAKLSEENGHSFWAKYHLLRLGRLRLKDKLFLGGSLYETSPESLSRSAFYARMAERSTGRSQDKYLDSIPAEVFDEFPSLNAVLILPIKSALAFAIYADLRLYVQQRLAVSDNISCGPEEPFLHLAIYSDKEQSRAGPEMTRLLLGHGLDMNFVFKDMSAFQYLYRLRFRPVQEFSELVEIYVENGQDASVDVKPGSGQPNHCKPIHISPTATIPLLLEHGADPNSLDFAGRTPVDYSIMNIRGDLRPTKEDSYKVFCILVAQGGHIQYYSSKELKDFVAGAEKEGFDFTNLRHQLEPYLENFVPENSPIPLPVQERQSQRPQTPTPPTRSTQSTPPTSLSPEGHRIRRVFNRLRYRSGGAGSSN